MKRVKTLGKGTIYKEKDGRLRAGFTVGYDGTGKQLRRTVSARTEPELYRKREDLIKELLKSNMAPGSITVETWAAYWLTEIAADKLEPRVLEDTRGKVRKYITPCLGRYLLQDVGAEEIRELHRFVRSHGVSERTVQIVHSVASVMFKAAVREDKIDVNPCDKVDRPRALSRPREALSVMEARRIIMCSIKEEDPLASLWASALFLGCRKNELLGLERPRLDLELGFVDLSWQIKSLPWGHGPGCHCGEKVKPYQCPERITPMPPGYEHRHAVGSYYWTRPKTTKSVRATPLPSPLWAGLDAYIRATPTGRLGLVWAKENGDPLSPRAVTAAWREACKRSGAPAVDFHCARHTTVSLLLEGGVSPEVIAQIVGHSTIASTRQYMHVNHRMAREAMDSLADVMAISPPAAH